MKSFRNFFCIMLALMMVLSCNVNVFAADYSTYTVTVNEYDAYVSSRAAEDSKLIKSGFSEESIQKIKSNSIEIELLRRSRLSREELANTYGYTSKQVEIIKNYNGERIENNPELRGVFANMTCDFSKVYAGISKLTIKVTWEWSSAPFFNGDENIDIVGMRWKGTNNSGQPLNLSLTTSGSSCIVKYYQGNTLSSSKNINIKTDDPYNHAYAKFSVGSDTNYLAYAKKGTLTIKVSRTGSDDIKEGAFVFAYGHSTFTISPSITFPASFGIGFSGRVETMCHEAVRMSSTGRITEY